MEPGVPTRNINTSARPAENPSPSPSKPPPVREYERPSRSRIAILTVLCAITYPAFYVLTLVARDKSLFIVRSIVSVWCWGGGFILGWMLLKIGAQHLEAATWATVIHMSQGDGGMKLGDLARSSDDPNSPLSALCMFWCWFMNRRARRSRKLFDKRPWSRFLVFFVLLAILAPGLPFLFGRIMVIETFIKNQRKVYHEVLIAGDLSQKDIIRSLGLYGTYQLFSQTWSLVPYGGSTSDTAEFIHDNNTVYFAQPSLSQFVPGGSGAGTFDIDQSLSIGLDTPNSTLVLTAKSDTGAVIRHPQWGLRIHCEKLPDPGVNLMPLSSQNFTYIFLPQDLLRGLFGVYDMDLPAQFTEPELGDLDPGDTIPSNIDTSTISFLVRMPDSGVSIAAHTFTYNEINQTGNPGFTAIETVLIRINTGFTHSGGFPVYQNKTLRGDGMTLVGNRIGYDAAVCMHKYEPWIIETYNTSIASPSALRIVEKGGGSTSPPPSGNIRGARIAKMGYLNTTGKAIAFGIAHANSLNQMVKDSGRSYLPSSTAVSLTDGVGPFGYTELSPDRLAVVRARIGAANALPYLAGSGPVVAQVYRDETLAHVTFEKWQLICLPILLWILGVIGELFVPTLPLNIPRRNFGVYSWLALFQSQELEVEGAGNFRVERRMSLNKLEEKFSDKRVGFHT